MVKDFPFTDPISIFTIIDTSKTINFKLKKINKDARIVINELKSFNATTGIMIQDLFDSKNVLFHLFIFDQIIIICENDDFMKLKQCINDIYHNSNIIITKKEFCDTKLIKNSITKSIIKKCFIRTQNHNPNFNAIDTQVKYHRNDFINIQQLNEYAFLYMNINDQYIYFIKQFDTYSDIRKKRFNQEKKFYEKINNQIQYISKYYGTFVDENNINYIIIEYINGQSLQKFLRNNGTNINYFDRIKLILQIMIAIEYIHLKGFKLRDLKHENIMIDSSINAFLIDFDFTKTDNLEMTNDIGSDYFVASEQYSTANYSFEADIFSLGIIIHLIMTMKDIDDSMNIRNIRNHINETKENFLIHFEKFHGPKKYQKLYDIYKKCTEFHPKNRPNISSLLNEVLLFIEEDIIDQDDIDIQSQSILKILIHVREKQFNSFLNNNDFKDTIKLNELYYYYGYEYYYGEYVDYNFDKSINYLTISSNHNNAKAQFLLGYIYYEDKLVSKDINKSIYYLTLSSDQNNDEAQYLLGFIYHEYKCTSDFIHKSIYYYKLSANQNNAHAQELLADMYYNNEMDSFDSNEMIKYYKLSADQGNSLAQFYLGKIYYEGTYIPKNIEKSIHYLKLSSDIHNFNSFFHLNKYKHCKNKKIIPYTEIEFIKTIVTHSLMILGIIYYKIRKNIKKSIKFFIEASKMNDSYAQYYLGCIYNDEENSFYDINKAIDFYTLSAKNQNIKALYELG